MKRLLECMLIVTAISLGGCMLEDDEGAATGDDETTSETLAEISAQKNNITTLGGAGLCLWVGGRCTHMPQCTVFWVESVNWSTGMAWGFSHYLQRWGHANKDYLTAGRFWYDPKHWCAAVN